ncbi:MAG: hypothetical protein LBU22_10780 [Dysgonamonadaceae bacterium]|jgi:hypothetical protein|nr:hypothetical protein [Dysgonamonadaceae bacterium]
MRKLDFPEMEVQIGGALDESTQSFFDGLVCGVGIGTITLGWGIILVAYGCGRALGLI